MSSLTNTQILLNEYLTQEQRENPQYARESDFFEFFSASQILKDYDLNDEEIEAGVCGGPSDGGCDCVYLLADGSLIDDSVDTFDHLKKGAVLEFVIIQAKTSTSFGEDAIQKWKSTCANLFDMDKDVDSYSDRYNDSVRASFGRFKKAYIGLVRRYPRINIRFYYVSKGIDVHPNVQAQADELIGSIKALFPYQQTTVDFSFVTADKLFELANTVKNNEFSLTLSTNPIISGNSNNFIALVNLVDFYRFITDEKGDLRRHIFEANVRDYQRDVSVNKDIRDTLETPSVENFWWLNNGVTIVASSIDVLKAREIMIHAPEIVNGLQTSNEIYNYFSRCSDRLCADTEQRELLVRIIVPTGDDSRDKIICATNNQTAIEKSSLRATDTIHRQIEMYFRSKELFYDRRKNFYKNSGKKPSQIVSVAFLSQCLISVLLQSPNDARARPTSLLIDDNRYYILYQQDQSLDVFYNIAYVGKQVERVLKMNSNYTISQVSDIKFYVLYTIFAKLLRHVKIAPSDIPAIDLGGIEDAYILRTAEEIFSMYAKLGGTDKIAKGTSLITTLKESLERQFSA